MRRRVYGMGSVQSVPRIMRGYPVIRAGMFDVPLAERRHLNGLDQQGLARTLSGLDQQGLARTLSDDIEMPEECMRAGEVLLAPGVCGPDPRRPLDPYASPAAPAVIVSAGTRLTVATPPAVAAGARGVVGSMSKTTMVLAAVGAVGLIYYLGKMK